MNIKYLYLLLIFIFFVGCNTRKNEPPYIRMSDRILTQYLEDMKKEHFLRHAGSGGGFLRQVNKVIVIFDLVGIKNREELRELLVIVTEELLRRYNENVEIRPHLKNYPFTEENCRISIYLVDSSGREIHNAGSGKEFLSSVVQSGGTVIYDITNDEKLASQEVYRETYQEALDIVKRSKAD